MIPSRPFALVLVGVAALAGSALACPAPRTASDWPDDPKSHDEAAVVCAAAASKLATLQCALARADFADLCVYEYDQGIPLHPQCIASATSCAEAEKC